MNIFNLVKIPTPTTLFAWYGDTQFARTLLAQLGWVIDSETEIDNSTMKLIFSEAETISPDESSKQLLFRSDSRWNLLIWPNDSGGALTFLDGMPLAMPVFETTFTDNALTICTVVGLGRDRHTLVSKNHCVDVDSTSLLTRNALIEENGVTIGIRWQFKLTNSLGLPITKSVTIYADPARTLTELGASQSLFDFSGESSGKRSVIMISELPE